MAVQYTPVPAYHPTPFVVYNNQRNTLLKDLGDALAAVGNIPHQTQQSQIQDQLGRLLLSSLNAPRTEMQSLTTPDLNIPYTSTSGVGAGIDPFSTGEMGSQQDFGNMIIPGTTTTKEVPGKEYSESTGRLEDVGYAGGGFNFRPTTGRRSLEDEMQLKKYESGLRKEEETHRESTRQPGKTDLERQRQEGKIRQLQLTTSSAERRQAAHDAVMKQIAGDNTKSIEQRAAAMLAETARHHKESEKNYGERTKLIRESIQSQDDLRNATMIDRWYDDLKGMRKQLDDIDAQPDQNLPGVRSAKQTAIGQYNAIVDKIRQIDPDAPLLKYTEEDTPDGIMKRLREAASAATGGFINPPQQKQLGTTPAGPPPARLNRQTPTRQAPSGTPSEEEVRKRMEQRGYRYPSSQPTEY